MLRGAPAMACSFAPTLECQALAALRPNGGGDGSTSTFFCRVIKAPGDGFHVARAWAEVFSAALPPTKVWRLLLRHRG